ncbi:MAG: prephenate dehydrogenase [Clostridia bacterium]
MNIGIVGLGLMGASLARAIIKNTKHTVFGWDTDPNTMLKAELLGALHERLTNTDYNSLDILIIALTPDAFKEELEKALPKLKAGAVVLDIAGNKRGVVAAMRQARERYPTINFIATHPMAGREFWGINHSTPLLFERASILIVPVAADIERLAAVKKLLDSIGFTDSVITDEHFHDKMIAYTSQLAHLVSSAYVKSPSAMEHDGFSAGSFRDLTRVAKLNAGMWTELMLENRDNLLKEMEIFIDNLNDFKDALNKGDADKLFALLAEGSQRKEAIEKQTRERKRNL